MIHQGTWQVAVPFTLADDDLNSFILLVCFCIIAIADTNQGIAVLLHQSLLSLFVLALNSLALSLKLRYVLIFTAIFNIVAGN